MSDREFMAALAAMGHSSTGTTASFAAASSAGSAAKPIGGDVCGTYKSVRPILVNIEPLLKGIPFIGPAVAEAIQQLMNVMDAACGTGGTSPTFAAPICSKSSDFHASIAAFGGAAAAVPAGVSPADICKVYTQIKPILDEIVPFLTLIPLYGIGIAAGIKALMTVLDSICKTS